MSEGFNEAGTFPETLVLVFILFCDFGAQGSIAATYRAQALASMVCMGGNVRDVL